MGKGEGCQEGSVSDQAMVVTEAHGSDNPRDRQLGAMCCMFLRPSNRFEVWDASEG